jgi:glycosyltransferase involved in cell wall biosynthesis
VRPVVSIIVPVFNRLHYLRPTVDSVFAQTFQDWELIFADDGSDDATLGYMSGLQQRPRVRLLRLPHSGNTAVVYNAALRHAAGDYVAFLGSDDVWLPPKLEMQIASLRARPERRWSYTGFRMVDAALNPLTEAVRPVRAEGWIIEQVLNVQAMIVHSTVVVARDLLDAVGPYDEHLPWCGDYELWARCALHSAVDCVEQPLVLIRRHAEHCCDDVTACQDFARALDRIRRYVTAGPQLGMLQKRRAIAAATLARSQAVNGRRRSALATVLGSVHRSWRYREWWVGAAGATALAVTPPRLRRALRAVRYRDSRQHP